MSHPRPRWTRIPSSSLRLSGPDRLDFVQGQMTAHLKAAPTPGRVPALFLNVRGQIEFAAQIYRREHDVYLHLAAQQAPALEARFKKYIIFDQVEVQDTSSVLCTLHLWGGELSGVAHTLNFALEGADTQLCPLGEMTLLVSRLNRSGTDGLEVHVLGTQLEGLLTALALEERPYPDLQAARVRAGIPDALEDGFLGDLPQECGLEPAVSYKKGCYIGQEIMARLEARGNARHHLVQLEGHDLPSHAVLEQGGKTVGKSGLSLGDTALAKARKELEHGAQVQLGGVNATLRLRSSLPTAP